MLNLNLNLNTSSGCCPRWACVKVKVKVKGGRHGGHRERHLALRFDAECTHHHHRRLSWRLNHGHFADSQTKAPRSLRLKPLVREQPRYSLCTCVPPLCTVPPRSHTVSVAVTIRLRDVYGACFQRPDSERQPSTTSSGRVWEAVVPSYVSIPESHGGAGAISGGLQGR